MKKYKKLRKDLNEYLADLVKDYEENELDSGLEKFIEDAGDEELVLYFLNYMFITLFRKGNIELRIQDADGNGSRLGYSYAEENRVTFMTEKTIRKKWFYLKLHLESTPALDELRDAAKALYGRKMKEGSSEEARIYIFKILSNFNAVSLVDLKKHQFKSVLDMFNADLE